jgi:4-hydroxy-tetrahydrodipicolinate synthase
MLKNGLIDYYRKIARSTTLPIVLYVRHEAVSADVLKEVAEEPNIVGVKYAINNLPSFSRAVQSIGEKLIWICGTAEMWAPYFFAAGAAGFTSGLVNVYPERSQALLELLRGGRFSEAMRLWNELRPFEELREMNANGNNVSVVKEAMRQLGRSNGIVRPPIGPLQPEEQAKVRDVLVRWGLLEHKGGESQ